MLATELPIKQKKQDSIHYLSMSLNLINIMWSDAVNSETFQALQTLIIPKLVAQYFRNEIPRYFRTRLECASLLGLHKPKFASRPAYRLRKPVGGGLKGIVWIGYLRMWDRGVWSATPDVPKFKKGPTLRSSHTGKSQ